MAMHTERRASAVGPSTTNAQPGDVATEAPRVPVTLAECKMFEAMGIVNLLRQANGADIRTFMQALDDLLEVVAERGRLEAEPMVEMVVVDRINYDSGKGIQSGPWSVQAFGAENQMRVVALDEEGPEYEREFAVENVQQGNAIRHGLNLYEKAKEDFLVDVAEAEAVEPV